MTANEWLVVGALVLMTLAMLTRRATPTVAVVGALLGLYGLGTIDASEAFGGFSNRAPIAIAALYVVAGGVDRSGALVAPVRRILDGSTTRSAMARLGLSTALLSTVVANTPVVAMLISPVRRWADKKKTAASKLLIPLSYATIVGGMVTVIGTSTNLAASGIVDASGDDPYSFFEPARIGLPVALACVGVIIAFGHRLMPDRGGIELDSVESPFTVSLVVEPGGALDSVSVADGGLRNLPSIYLVGLERGDEVVAPVGPDHVLHAGDILTFAGQVNQVVDMDHLAGLRLLEAKHVWALEDGSHAWFEAALGASSPLIGKTIKQADFRRSYQAAVVALQRSGETIDAKLGEVRLQTGDSLLLVADDGFRDRYKRRGDFLLIHRRSEPPPTAKAKASTALMILAAVAVLPIFGVVDVLKSSVLGAAAVVVSGVLTPRQARDAIDLDVIVMIAAAIGIGASVESTGLAARIGAGVGEVFGGGGVWLASLGLVLATLLLTELVTNAGAVAIMLPIGLNVAVETGGDPRIFALGITVAASASFLSPIGYQTNTMVFAPGRYRSSDYLRLGIPLTILVIGIVPVCMTLGRGLW
ncbi:MAG: SLC13 family permease [Acidimicrobiales bacterium]